MVFPLNWHVARSAPVAKVRRAPHLVVYWKADTLIVRNYATGRTVRATPLLCLLLDFCHAWRSTDDIAAAFRLGADQAVRLTRRLVALTMLERAGRARDARVAAMSVLDPWNPETGFFHSATRDVRFWSPATARRKAASQADLVPMPAPVKRVGTVGVRLPAPSLDGPFAETLLNRRTWRRYSAAPVEIEELATILGLSAGVQHWARTPAGEVPFKTSPSGGARHPIECYVVIRDVRGMKPGIYHYACDSHVLERVRGRVSLARMKAYVPRSEYFARASAMVFFTAVFERQLWRYPYSRAYRAALIEAGHVCQTFLLTATALGLAPYCVMGLADSVIEKDLGLDGITESVLYCAGVGRPPRGTAWAPLPRGTIRTRPNPGLARK
jgi:SagB-type dehydrogenase family enzyme